MEEKVHFNKGYLYFLSFIEGGSVMACELIGAKMLAPFFGTSLYVWAAALGLTLGGLMTGYFTGGILSRKFKNDIRLLYLILILAGVTLFLMPFTSGWVMQTAIDLPLQWGALLSLLIFMFPPLIFMGMVSPVIINLLTEQAKHAGNSAGNVYAISTLGGILVTFLLGFYVIPTFGISWPAMIGGIVLCFFPAVSLLRRRNLLGAGALIALLLLFGFKALNPTEQAEGTLYHSEGVMGQVKVIDMPLYADQPDHLFRILVVNNTMQTIMDLEDPDYNYWKYTGYMPQVAGFFPAGSRTLLLGMGGGTLVKRLEKLNHRLDIVEIDGRIKEAAIQYFGLDPDHHIIVDDARHVLKTTDKEYKVVIFDTFKGESAPEHVVTLEGLEDTKNVLAEDGVVLINFYGYLDGDIGKITRSVYKTMQAAGFEAVLYTTPGTPDVRNILLVGYLQKDHPIEDYLDTLFSPGQAEPVPARLSNHQIDTMNAVMLTDERPQTDLYARAAAQWRMLYNQFLTREFSSY